MISVTKVFKADASHVLPDHNGKCANRHGHTYTYEVTVTRRSALLTEGSSRGMVVDFGDLTTYWTHYVEPYLDHVDLNESLGIYPTAENIALWVGQRLQPFCIDEGIRLVSVSVHEGPGSFATFTLEDWSELLR